MVMIIDYELANYYDDDVEEDDNQLPPYHPFQGRALQRRALWWYFALPDCKKIRQRHFAPPKIFPYMSKWSKIPPLSRCRIKWWWKHLLTTWMIFFRMSIGWKISPHSDEQMSIIFPQINRSWDNLFQMSPCKTVPMNRMPLEPKNPNPNWMLLGQMFPWTLLGSAESRLVLVRND